MELDARPAPYIIPPYSLTGDLLSFIRCGLQYRMQGIGNLPSTRPVQMWFGQFVHGVLEECYRTYREERTRDGAPYRAPGKSVLDDVCDLVARRLAAQGLRPRSGDVAQVGRARVQAAVDILGPALFPLIRHAEVRLTGTRLFPEDLLAGGRPREADRYEMKGIVDVITHIELADPRFSKNWLVKAIHPVLPPDVPGSFEVIVDYKGMRRPAIAQKGSKYAGAYEWQLQTYAKLRSVQSGALPVAAGILIYLNELWPTWTDLKSLREEIHAGTTDVLPPAGSAAEAAIKADRGARGEKPFPDLPEDFRIQRALKVVPISEESQEAAAEKFDGVVAAIERSRIEEQSSGRVLKSWPAVTDDAATCVACDWRTICPSYAPRAGIRSPSVPGR